MEIPIWLLLVSSLYCMIGGLCYGLVDKDMPPDTAAGIRVASFFMLGAFWLPLMLFFLAFHLVQKACANDRR